MRKGGVSFSKIEDVECNFVKLRGVAIICQKEIVGWFYYVILRILLDYLNIDDLKKLNTLISK